MNKVFKVIWNQATQSWVAVSELTRLKTKSSAKVDLRVQPSKLLLALSAGVGTLIGGSAIAAVQLTNTQVLISGDGATQAQAVTGTGGSGLPPNAIAIGSDASISSSQYGQGIIAIGQSARAGAFDATKTSGENGIAIGRNANVSQSGDIALGANALIKLNQVESSPTIKTDAVWNVLPSVAIGYGTTSQGTSGDVILGAQANNKENTNFVIGQSTAIGSRAFVYGDQASALSADSSAIGNSSIALGGDDINSAKAQIINSVPEVNELGININALENLLDVAKKNNVPTTMILSGGDANNVRTASVGDVSVAIGAMSQSGGVGSVAIGVNAITRGEASIAQGVLARANANNSMAIGTVAMANSTNSVAIGHYALAQGNNSISLGERAHTHGINSVAIGTRSNVTGAYSVALGPNIAQLETVNSVVLGNASTQVVGSTGASHAVEEVTSASLLASDGTTVTYSGFAGQPKTAGQYVSIGEVGNERQLKNVAAGHIEANSTDGINGSQLYAVVKRIETGWRVSNNANPNVSTILPNDEVNFVNGTGTTAVVTPWTDAEGRTNANVTFNVNKTPLVASNGVNITNDDDDVVDSTLLGKVRNPAAPDAFATAGDIANAINNSGWIVTSDVDGGKRDGDAKTATKELVKPGEEVKFLAGKNLKIKQDGQNFTYSTVDNPTFANVTASNMTIGSNTSNPIEIGTTANGENQITGLNRTLPRGESTQPVLDKDGNPVTNEDGSPVTYVSNIARSSLPPIDPSKAATLGDVLNAGWNLQENSGARDFVKPYDTVNFVNGTGTTVNITSNGNVSVVKVDVVKADVNTNTNPNQPADINTNTPETGKVTANGTGYVTADTLAKAVNSSGWKVTSDTVDGGKRADAATEKDKQSNELVQPGEEVKFLAGKNLQITQNGQNFTYATQENVSFNNVNTTTMTLGNTTNPEQPAVNFKTEKATPANVNPEDSSPTAAVNLSDTSGNPVQLKGVGSSLNTTKAPTNNPDEKVLDLTEGNYDPTAVVTAADLKNYGWIVNTPLDKKGTVVNNAEVVNFIGKNGINVTSVANGTKGNWDVVITQEKPTYTANGENSTAAISFNNGNGTKSNVVTYPNGSTAVSFDVNQTSGDVNENGVSSVQDPNAFLNAGNVAKLVNNAGWNVFQNNVTTPKKDTVTAANNVAFNNGTYTTVNVTSDGTNTTITYDAKIGNLTNNANGTVNEGDISPNSLATAAGVAKAINESGWVTQVNTLDKDGNPVVDANGKPVTSPQVVKPGRQVNYVAGQGTTAQTTVDPKTGALSVSYSVNNTTADVNDKGSVDVPANPNAYLNAGEVAKLVNGVSWTVDSKTDAETANAATKNTYKASAKVKAGDTVRINAGRNIEISGEGHNINIATSDNPSFANVSVAGTVKANKVVADKVDAKEIVASNSLSVGTGSNPVVINNNGINVGNKRITNVAPGVNATDAVNVSQLKGAVTNINNRMGKMDKRLRAGIAGSAAIGNLPQVHTDGKSQVAAGVASYRGQNAVAVGYSRLSDNGKVILKLSGSADTQGDVIGAASVGYEW